MTYSKIMFLLVSILCFPFIGFTQDSLLRADLSKHVHQFEIIDNIIVGKEAKKLLEKEAQENQYFLLGEFHGSPGISKLTKALIPMLNEAGFKNFGIEVGPSSVDFLKEFANEPSKTVALLNTFNKKYNILDQEDGYVNTVIPFFDSVEDAEFLQEAGKNNWNLIGLDQEYVYCFIPLMDRMFNNIKKEDQTAIASLYQEAKDSIIHFYKLDEYDKKALSHSIRDSKVVNSFFKKVLRANNKNKKIIKAIQKTVEIYGYNASRKYYSCNSSRINYMKENLKNAFDENEFDLQKDKLFLKMGGIHTTKGFSWLSLYELGNTLHELASFHGNKSIHISFRSRYYYEDGKVVDDLENENSYTTRYIDFAQFAKKDQWTIIDLRPVKVALFYSRKYKVSEVSKRTFEQHDLIIIPPLEEEGTPNY